MSPAAAYLREHRLAITQEWERAVVADLRQLASLSRGALLDHLPEVLNGLAAWLEGDTEAAERGFVQLADGHAIQRLGFGIELPSVIVEYSWLRRIVLRHLVAALPAAEVTKDLLAFDEGLDRAIHIAVQRYTTRREYVRNRFVGILGHDLRNPLNAATMAAGSLLGSSSFTDTQHRSVMTIVRSTERMARMIRDVLDFAHGHLAGGVPATPVPCDLEEICRLAVAEMESTRAGRAVAFSSEGDVRGAFDRDRLFQAISNLLGNAFEHGQPPVTLRCGESDDREAVFVRVTNAGEPIAAASLATIFTAFSNSNRGSLGLGLYIADQIARAHGGSCDVDSREGETTFTLTLPRTPLDIVPDRE